MTSLFELNNNYILGYDCTAKRANNLPKQLLFLMLTSY